MNDFDKIKSLVIEVVNEIQELSGREKMAISGDMCPVGALDGFDSLNAIEATMSLAENLNIEVPIDINLLVSDEECPKSLTIDEITANICDRYLKND